MSDDIQEEAFGQQCRECGGYIGEHEGREIVEGEEIIAYVHANCA